jgi:CRISPR system Cascade subunit CasD
MPPYTLILRLEGNMQSYGFASSFTHRGTHDSPTKSAVIGMIAAAAGLRRHENITELTKLKFGVRIDKPGSITTDYQTTQNIITANQQKTETGISHRQYLQNAAFIVGLESADLTLLEIIHANFKNPWFTITLGRRNCLPSFPIAITPNEHTPHPIQDKPLKIALQDYPPLTKDSTKKPKILIEDPNGSNEINDQPTQNHKNRAFTARRYTATYGR